MIGDILFSIVFLFLAVYDIVPLFQNKQWRAFYTYTALIAAGYILLILILLNVNLPTPNDIIKKAVDAVMGRQN